MSLILSFIVIPVATFAFLYLVIGPIMVRLTNRQCANPDFKPCGLGELPGEVSALFNETTGRLREEGFEPISCLWLPDHVPMVTCYALLLKNPHLHDLGLGIAIHTTTGMKLHYVAFCSEFYDHTEITTNNCTEPGVFRKAPDKKLFSFPEIRDARHLYRAHRRLIERHAPGVESFLPCEGNEVLQVAHSITKELREQAEFGLLYLDAKRDLYRPTWKGAALMTWQLVPPVRAIRRARLRSSARRLQSELAV
jgi:hypothetical protein